MFRRVDETGWKTDSQVVIFGGLLRKNKSYKRKVDNKNDSLQEMLRVNKKKGNEGNSLWVNFVPSILVAPPFPIPPLALWTCGWWGWLSTRDTGTYNLLTHSKHMLVKLDHFSTNRGKKKLLQTTTHSFHHGNFKKQWYPMDPSSC